MHESNQNAPVVAVIIPCYRSEGSVGSVISRIPDLVKTIYCVNDASDDNLAQVLEEISDANLRVRVLTHKVNQGVGGATVCTGPRGD